MTMGRQACEGLHTFWRKFDDVVSFEKKKPGRTRSKGWAGLSLVARRRGGQSTRIEEASGPLAP